MTKKRALIIGLVVLTVIFCLGFFVYHGITQSSRIKDFALVLGNELIASLQDGENISSEHAVFIGEHLRSILNARKQDFIMGYTIDCYHGDANYPLGDRKAQYRLIIRTNNKTEPITLRLKYDNNIKKFHILGFYTGD